MSCNCDSRAVLSFLQEIKAELGFVKGKCQQIEKELFGISNDAQDTLVAVMETTTVRQILEKLVFDVEWLKRDRKEVKKEAEKVRARAVEELKRIKEEEAKRRSEEEAKRRSEEEVKRRSEEETKRLEETRTKEVEARELKKIEEKLPSESKRRNVEIKQREQMKEDEKSEDSAKSRLPPPASLKERLLIRKRYLDLERKTEPKPDVTESEQPSLQAQPTNIDEPGKQILDPDSGSRPETAWKSRLPPSTANASLSSANSSARFGRKSDYPRPQEAPIAITKEKKPSSAVDTNVCSSCSYVNPRHRAICELCDNRLKRV